MEGGSIAQVCYMNGIDFVVIRAISDNADDVGRDQGQSHSHSYGNGPSQFNDGYHGNQKYP